MLVDTADLLPMSKEMVGCNTFRMREEQPVKGAFHRIEDYVPVLIRQEDDSPPLADDYVVPPSHWHKVQ